MAPAIWLLATPQGQVITALVLLGMAKSVRIWLQPLVEAMTHKSSFLGIVLRRTPLGVIVKGINWVNHKAAHAISHHATAHAAPLARYTQGIAHRTRAVNAAHVNFADATAHAMYRQRHVVMPNYVKARVRPVMRRAVAAQAAAGIALGRVAAEERSRRRSISHINTKLGALALGFLGIDYLVKRHHARSHQHAHLHTIPQTAAQVGRTRAQVRAHARRISRLEKLLGVTALTAVVAAILARTIPSWRCSNFRNIRRLLKCSHWRWLEAMLFLAVDALTLQHLCDLVATMQSALESIVPRYIEPLVLDAENFICGGRSSAPWGIVASDWEDVPARTWGV